YACCINNLNGRGIDYTIDHFVSMENLPLLYLLCHAYQGHFGNGCIIDEEQLQIELDYIEGIFIDSRHISFSLLQEIIFSAIERKNPLYCHFPSDKRIKKFYDDIV
ncbi:TPA: hypothetical protein DCZ36_00030, partial [Candidatus Gracilibacteria bacterium]|nr:hypothetical protein [Candidatus Gracilibacteria bacterium]